MPSCCPVLSDHSLIIVDRMDHNLWIIWSGSFDPADATQASLRIIRIPSILPKRVVYNGFKLVESI